MVIDALSPTSSLPRRLKASRGRGTGSGSCPVAALLLLCPLHKASPRLRVEEQPRELPRPPDPTRVPETEELSLPDADRQTAGGWAAWEMVRNQPRSFQAVRTSRPELFSNASHRLLNRIRINRIRIIFSAVHEITVCHPKGEEENDEFLR